MNVKVTELDTFVLKVQRPVIASSKHPPLLICSEDGVTVPARMVPDEGIFHTAMIERRKAYFLCCMENNNIRILGELNRRDTA